DVPGPRVAALDVAVADVERTSQLECLSGGVAPEDRVDDRARARHRKHAIAGVPGDGRVRQDVSSLEEDDAVVRVLRDETVHDGDVVRDVDASRAGPVAVCVASNETACQRQGGYGSGHADPAPHAPHVSPAAAIPHA